MSDANRVSVKYVPEVTYGTTPVDSANWQALRFTGETIGGEINTTESAEIRSDRMLSDLPKVGTTVNPGLSGEFSPDTYDDFLEAVLGGSWTADVLEVGTNDYSFTIEKQFEDLTTAYVQTKGVRVGNVDLALAFGAISTVEIGMAGNFSGTATSSLVGAGSTTAATTTPVFNGSADISGIKIDDVASDLCFQSLNLSLNANLRPQECLGSDAPSNQQKGSMSVSGDFTAYLEDLVLEGKKINNTSFSLEFTISVGGAGYTILLPNLKFSGATPSASGKDTDVLQEGQFTGLYDATEATSIRITRL